MSNQNDANKTKQSATPGHKEPMSTPSASSKNPTGEKHQTSPQKDKQKETPDTSRTTAQAGKTPSDHKSNTK